MIKTYYWVWVKILGNVCLI